jgi:hypothetical protein
MKKFYILILLAIIVTLGFFALVQSIKPLRSHRKNIDRRKPLKDIFQTPPAVDSHVFSSKSEELIALLKTDNVPIDFYGVVVDESGKPLTDVEVLWDIVKSGSFAPTLGLATGASGFRRTSSDGRFSVDNENGCSLEIKSLTKTGYHEINRTVRSFGYGSTPEPHQPIKTKPEKYVLIKDGGGRAVKKEIPLCFDWDGEMKEIEISLAGRNEMMIITPELRGKSLNARYSDWKIKIEMKNAQLITSRMGEARLAPIDGYLPAINLQNDTDGQWGSNASALIYIKTADNLFGEVIFCAYSDRDSSSSTGSLSIRWNPEGGRVFE